MVASIRPTADGVNTGPPIGMRITGSQARFSGLSLKDYISMAYDKEPPQVVAPEWAGQQRFEIAATVWARDRSVRPTTNSRSGI